MKSQENRLLPPMWVLTVFVCFFSIWLLRELRDIVVLLVVGYSVAYIIEPAVGVLERRGYSRSVGVILVLLSIILAVLLLGATAVPTVYSELNHLLSNLPSFVRIANERIIEFFNVASDRFPWLKEHASLESISQSALAYLNGDSIKKVATAVFSTLMQGYSVTLAVLNLALLPFIIFYISADFKVIHRGLLELFPITRRAKAEKLAQEMNSYVSAFVRGQITVCSVLFILYAIGLKLLGVELWLLISVVAGFGNMIPYFGTIIGFILASIMALVTFGNFIGVVQAWGIFLLVQALEGMVITPKVMGKNVGMSPLMILLAICAGGQLFGLLGVFLAIPGAAVIRVLLTHIHRSVMGAQY